MLDSEKLDIDRIEKYDRLEDGTYKLIYKDGTSEVKRLTRKQIPSLVVSLRHRLKQQNESLEAQIKSAQSGDATPGDEPAKNEPAKLERPSALTSVPADASKDQPSKDEIDKALELSKKHPLDAPVSLSGDYEPIDPSMQLFKCAPHEISQRIYMGYRPARWEDVRGGDILRNTYNLLPGQNGGDLSTIRINEQLLMIIPKSIAEAKQKEFDAQTAMSEEIRKAMPNTKLELIRS